MVNDTVNLIPLHDETGVARWSRATRFEVEVLDRTEKPRFLLQDVEPGGVLEWSASASVKGSGRITVRDTGQDIDWLNDRLRFTAYVSDDGGEEYTVPLGVFLCAAPVGDWDETGRLWEVELVDKSSILDQDVIMSPQGTPGTFSLSKGDNVVEKVKQIIVDTGESVSAIDDYDEVLASDIVWDAGTTRLKIINDLLDAANFFSLWVDEYGRFRVSKYRAPYERPPAFSTSNPLVESDTSLMSPEWEHDEDIYSIPNRFIAVQNGSDEEEGLVAVATNEDPEDRFSFQARGRWITEMDTGVEAVDQAALDALAERRLAAASDKAATYEIQHVFLPGLKVNDTIEFSAGDQRGVLTVVNNTSVVLDPVVLCDSTVRRVRRDR